MSNITVHSLRVVKTDIEPPCCPLCGQPVDCLPLAEVAVLDSGEWSGLAVCHAGCVDEELNDE